MPAKLLTPQQEEYREKIGFMAGLKGAAIGIGLGALATVAVYRSSSAFRALSKPMQSVMIVSGATSGYLFSMDRASTAYENNLLGYADEYSLEQQQSSLVKADGFVDSALHYLNDNRWTVIGLSWAASMAGALGYSFSNRYLSTQQKLVQARMYAQAVTIVVLMASAGLSIYMGDDDKNKKHNEQADAQLRAVLNLPVEQEKIVR